MRYRFALLLAVWAVWAAPAARAADEKPHREADLLRQEADSLIATAVKRPYGWGWTDAPPDEPAKKGKPAFVPIAMGPAETPAAGLVLLWAAEVLKEPKYAEAARQVARGVAASQLPSGRFHSPAMYGATSAAGKELLTPLPDRGPTRAALALLLSLETEGDDAQQQEALRRAASRGAGWLLKQQAESGGWPVLYPPDAAVKETSRIVRLDTPDTRDSTLAMLLAYETLGDSFQRRSVERSIEWLLKARSGAALPIGAGLWESAYTLMAQPVEKMIEFPHGYDLLASRYSAQTFLSAYAVLGDGSRLTAAELAVKSIGDLIKDDDGRWHRRYNFRGVALDNVQAADAPQGPFGDATKPEEKAPPSDPGLPILVETVATARQLGREKFREQLSAGFTPNQHLAIVTAGLGDDPMTAELGSDPVKVEGYLERLESSERDGAELAGKVRRLWACYLRARLERDAGR